MFSVARHSSVHSTRRVCLAALLALAACGGDAAVAPDPPQDVAGFWSGTAAGVHVHVTLIQQGSVLTLDAAAVTGQRTLYPLDAQGRSVLGSANPVDLTSVSGTVNAQAVTFSMTNPSGPALTFVGTSPDGLTLVGEIHSTTLTSTPLTLTKTTP